MKVLIVEDELKTLLGISSMLEEISGDIELAGQARSGEKGIVLALEQKPDLIITDIRMNGMTGLEMIKKLNEMQVKCRYMILSGYAEFGYAREAISLGSMDYLLKPISREQLEESLKKVRTAIEEEGRKIVTACMETEVILERALFMQGFAGSQFESELLKRFRKNPAGYLLLIRGENRIVAADFEAIRRELGALEPDTVFYACREDGNKENYVYFPEASEEIAGRLEKWAQRCREKINPYIVFSGAVISDIRAIHETRGKLLELSNWNLSFNRPVILTKEKTAEIKTQKLTYPGDIERSLINSIQEGRIDDAERKLGEFVVYLKERASSYREVREAMICLTAAVLYAIRRASYGLYENISNLNILEWVKELLFLDHYPRIMGNVLRQYEQYMMKLKSAKHPIVNKVLQILEKEYDRELPLEEMAERMDVTPEYLSTLFMKELGIKYTTYRSQIRIDVAKKLLQEGKWKIYEVAKQSGYPDVKYFTKVFKKYTGVSPGEYIRTLVKN